MAALDAVKFEQGFNTLQWEGPVGFVAWKIALVIEGMSDDLDLAHIFVERAATCIIMTVSTVRAPTKP